MPNRQIIEFLLEHNQNQSKLYCSPDITLSRRQYRFKHPTSIAAMKCMDGRLNLSIITKTPPGIIQPFRNIGGKFDLGWPYFGELMSEFVNSAISKGSNSLILVTYHWSRGNNHRGCKGFNYNVKEAFNYTQNLKEQVERIFGKLHQTVYPVLVGIETDEDALVLHGEKGKLIDLSKETKTTPDELHIKLQRLYPDMKMQILNDFFPLLLGNLDHIAAIRKKHRPVEDVEHKEQIMAIGRGFDWLHLPNKALIIGPYSYNLAESILTAGNILLDNMKKGRTPQKNGVVLMTSAVYRDEAGPEIFRAIEKAKSLANFSLETIRGNIPDLLKHIHPLVGTLNLNTRLFTKLDFEKGKE